MNWLEKELVAKGVLERSEDGQLELSAHGRAQIADKSLLGVLLEPPLGEPLLQREERDYAAEEAQFEQLQQMLNGGNWEQRQQDPDNWLVIPEFGVMPLDVQFEGFAFPIVRADDSQAGWQRPIREAVRAVREEAKRRFGSLQELRAALGRVLAEVDGSARERKWSTNELFAFHYDCFFQHLRWTYVDHRRAKPRWIEHLARALEIAVYIRSSDLPRPDFVKRVQSQLASMAGHASQAPKQEAKRDVKEWWDAWQSNPAMYPDDKAFQAAMLDKYPVLKSPRVIRRWCLSWTRAQL